MARDYAFDIDAPTGSAEASGRPSSMWRRLYEALLASRQRAAEREIERYINMRGGKLTDELEREISRKFGAIVGQ